MTGGTRKVVVCPRCDRRVTALDGVLDQHNIYPEAGAPVCRDGVRPRYRDDEDMHSVGRLNP